MTRVVATASAGGHWMQLMRLRPAWADMEVSYITTDPGLERTLRQQADPGSDGIAGFHCVVDANLSDKLGLIWQLLQLIRIMLSIRPDVVITTGAAPGYFALRIGRILGARTIWIDSIANADELSLSGKRIGAHADHWLTQWEHLAKEDGPSYLGSVI